MGGLTPRRADPGIQSAQAMESSTALSAERLCVLLLAPLLVLLTLVPAASASSRRSTADLLRLEVNRVRAEHGLPGVSLSSTLDSAARRHSDEMAGNGVLTHRSPDGSSMAQRLARVGWRGHAAGENIAVARRAEAVVRLWLESPPHRAILLSDTYDSIGIGISSGTYHGHAMQFVTADFAR